MAQVFGEDRLEYQGIDALKGLKQFMCINTDTIHYVIVSTRKSFIVVTFYFCFADTAKDVSSRYVATGFLSLH